MATAFTKKRIVTGVAEFKLGHCIGPIGAKLDHAETDPETGQPKAGTCKGVMIAYVDTKNYKAGTPVYCQCECHGEDQPEAWPGYESGRADAPAPVEDDENDVKDRIENGDVELAPVAVSEPPLPQMGNPSDETPEAPEALPAPAPVASPAVAAGPEPDRTETKRFTYPEGYVARTERPSVTRQGNDVVLVEWLAYNLAGARVGEAQWARKAARELLL